LEALERDMNDLKGNNTKNEGGRRGGSVLGRRDLMKLGAGIAVTTLSASAQSPAPASKIPLTETGTGYKNDANRSSGNGPMDDTTRQIVKWVSSFSESDVNGPLANSIGDVMLDSMASLISGFESEPARISARLAQTTQSNLKCTVLGYGVTTSPEMAAFANGCMLRHTDFNDIGPIPEGASHLSDIISGILAIGEALHSTGSQMLAAIAVGYEVEGALSAVSRGFGWDSPFEGVGVSMAVGKLMAMNEDQLANALSLTLVPHMPLKVTHVGALSHWKGCHSPESAKCAVWAALMAKEGMTGPSMPFEARYGLWDHDGPFIKELSIPVASSDGRMVVQRMGFKRTPSEGSSQAILEVIPEFRAWTRVDDIVSIHIEMPFAGWQEIADPPKWDPRNRETADHSLPYIVARALMDGEIYLDSFTPEKFMDSTARRLMSITSVAPNPSYVYMGQNRITVRTKDGGVKTKETSVRIVTQMTRQDIVAKFKRVCAFMHVSDEQRDRALAEWVDLRTVKDIAQPMRTLAKFGNPLPL
jgi:2-methylcitrate dehydratase